MVNIEGIIVYPDQRIGVKQSILDNNHKIVQLLQKNQRNIQILQELKLKLYINKSNTHKKNQ